MALQIRKQWFLVVICLILSAGALSRFYGAWAMRYITDYDCSIAGLMARHIAEGREFPVFFYGQAYMGSFEPTVSALLFRCFGESGFVLNLGPALLALTALVLAVMWARDAGGMPAAIFAGLLLVMGPDVYYRFQFAARGGYMAALFFQTLVIYLVLRAAARLRNQHPVAPAFYFSIGVVSGLGWWSNMMITPALLVSAGLLLLASGWHPRRAGMWPGSLGFFLGSAPFWFWNAFNGWASFRTAEHMEPIPFVGRIHFLFARYRQLIGAWPEFTTGTTIIFIFYPLGVLFGLWILWRELRRRDTPPGTLDALAAAAMHLIVSLCIYFFSRQIAMNTARFLIPIVPSAVVLCASSMARFQQRVGKASSILVVLLIATLQTRALVSLHEYSAQTAKLPALDLKVADWLAEQPIEIVYAHYNYIPLNFRIGEETPFVNLQRIRYHRFALISENARHTAFINDHGGIREFLRRTDGQFMQTVIASLRFSHQIWPPHGTLAEIPPDTWMSFRDARGHDVMPLAADRNAATIWEDPLPNDTASKLVVRLPEPRPLREVRLWAPNPESVPKALRVEILPAGQAFWEKTHSGKSLISNFYWCGPRPYWSGRRAHLAYRFPNDPRVTAVRFIRPEGARHARYPWRLTELQIFEPGPDSDALTNMTEEAQALDELWTALQRHEIRRLYAGRWISNQAYDALGGAIDVELDRRAYPQAMVRRDGAVAIDAATAFVVEPEDAPLTLRMLREAGYAPRAQSLGTWSLIVFDHDIRAPDGTSDSLWWTGRYLLRKH